MSIQVVENEGLLNLFRLTINGSLSRQEMLVENLQVQRSNG